MASASPVNSRLYAIDKLELKQIGKNTLLQRPLGKSIYGEDCYLYRNSRFEQWSKKGKPLEDWNLPDEEIEWINLQSGNLITINEGSQTLWHCAPKKKPEVIIKLKVGYLDINIWTQWENSLIQTFVAKTPFEPPYIFYLINNKITRDERKFNIENPIKFKPLEVHRFHVTSKDGTKVPYIVIHEKGVKPKAQFIYIYGAYGSSTPIGWPYAQWYPLLKRKWAMVFALVRGGGDIDAAWAELARRQNRHIVVEDFEAVIRAAQNKNNLGPKETVIYGRSAGGLPIGAIVSRFPYGNLVGAAFTEVPYVDVLRTSSNPDLPLTIGEFEEFGNPLDKIMNFRALMDVSPVNTLPPGGAPGVFVMSRVGLLDKQVYAYESFKWIQKLRGYTAPDESNMSDPKGKYVTFERKEAHFYRPKRFPRFRAIDFAILDNWVDGKLKF
jgi:prolyl oligopeptidase PreP (S9A serine peptidase family)